MGLMQGGSISNCSVSNFTVDRLSAYNNYYRIGGLVGFASQSETTISECSVDGVLIRGWYSMGGLVGSIQAPKTTITNCSVNDVTIEHAYAVADDPTYSSSPVVGDMGVSGVYTLIISGMNIGSWKINCTHAQSSVEGWVAQDATAWPYVGEIVPEATITVDGVAATVRSLTESDMTAE